MEYLTFFTKSLKWHFKLQLYGSDLGLHFMIARTSIQNNGYIHFKSRGNQIWFFNRNGLTTNSYPQTIQHFSDIWSPKWFHIFLTTTCTLVLFIQSPVRILKWTVFDCMNILWLYPPLKAMALHVTGSGYLSFQGHIIVSITFTIYSLLYSYYRCISSI